MNIHEHPHQHNDKCPHCGRRGFVVRIGPPCTLKHANNACRVQEYACTTP